MMLVQISAIAVLMAGANAQGPDQCEGKPAHVNFMRCISFKMNGFPRNPNPQKYSEFEDEYYSAMTARGQSCESNGCSAGLDSYNEGDFLKRGGVLHKECKICYKVTKNVMKFITKSSTPEQRSCVRKEFGALLSEEMDSCLNGKLGYTIPPFSADDIPDFDAMGDVEENHDAVEESISYAVNAFYQFNKCNGRARSDALTCFQTNSKLPTHCRAARSCDKRSVNRDGCTMGEVHGATCECLSDNLKDAKDFAKKVLDAVEEAIKNKDPQVCADEIYASLVSLKTNKNLLDELERILSDCEVKSLGGMKKYLRIGCKIAQKKNKSKNKKAATMETIIALVNALIDATSLRISRFCPDVCA